MGLKYEGVLALRTLGIMVACFQSFGTSPWGIESANTCSMIYGELLVVPA